jgi:prefoldin beta subunit
MDMQVQELERTVEALDDIEDDTDVYRDVGRVLVSVEDPEDLRTELEEEKETLEVRLESVEKQEEGLRDRMETLQETLQNMLGEGPQGPA